MKYIVDGDIVLSQPPNGLLAVANEIFQLGRRIQGGQFLSNARREREQMAGGLVVQVAVARFSVIDSDMEDVWQIEVAEQPDRLPVNMAAPHDPPVRRVRRRWQEGRRADGHRFALALAMIRAASGLGVSLYSNSPSPR